MVKPPKRQGEVASGPKGAPAAPRGSRPGGSGSVLCAQADLRGETLGLEPGDIINDVHAVGDAHAHRLPTLLVIGAAKAGTTSLHHHLDAHPEIAMAREKELHFFVGRDAWGRGINWYCRQFDASVPHRGESSVSYTAYPRHTGVPALMHSVLPGAKLLYIVRDPIQRIVSAYVHRFSDGIERRPLSEAVSQLEDNDLVERSRYHYQLEQYLPFYPLSSIHVLSLEALRADPVSVMRGVYAFVGADPDFASSALSKVWNPTSVKRRKGPVAQFLQAVSETAPARLFTPQFRERVGKVLYRPFSTPIQRPEVDSNTQARLSEFLKPDADKLRELTGQSFREWSV